VSLPWLRPSPSPSPWGRESGSLWCGVCPRRRATWCDSCFAAEVAGASRATHAGQRCARLAAAATATLTPVVRCLYSAHMRWWDRTCDGGGANIGVQVALQWAPLGEIVWRRVLEGQLLSNHAPVRSGLVRKAVRLLPCASPPLLDGHTKRFTHSVGAGGCSPSTHACRVQLRVMRPLSQRLAAVVSGCVVLAQELCRNLMCVAQPWSGAPNFLPQTHTSFEILAPSTAKKALAEAGQAADAEPGSGAPQPPHTKAEQLAVAEQYIGTLLEQDRCGQALGASGAATEPGHGQAGAGRAGLGGGAAVRGWILKPSESSNGNQIHCFGCGDGVGGDGHLTGATRAALSSLIENDRPWLVQRYIERPLLLRGCKTHCRAYVLVVGCMHEDTSVYLHREASCTACPLHCPNSPRLTDKHAPHRARFCGSGADLRVGGAMDDGRAGGPGVRFRPSDQPLRAAGVTLIS
jgi:hypothetical protein